MFAGTPKIAKECLDALIKNKFSIDLVITKPDKAAHRGQKINYSPVKELALNNNIQIEQPNTLNNQEIIEKITSIDPDFIIVVAYGLLIPNSILKIPKFGCINAHMSLLPKFRGAAPIARVIENGEENTGVTIIKINEELDAGDILIQKSIQIAQNENSNSLHDKLAVLGSNLIIEYLNTYAHIIPIPQKQENASYAKKISKEEAKINWSNNSLLIERKIRAYNPFPIAFTFLKNNLVKIYEAKIYDKNIISNKPPGSIIVIDKKTLIVQCGNNTFLNILKLQEANKKVLEINQYLSGHQNLENLIFE